MSKVCKGCLRWNRIENKCDGWSSPIGCNPIYNAGQYHKEITEMITHYRTRASAGATSRLIQEMQPKLNELKIIMSQGIEQAYREDTSRGSGGGKSESDANAATSRKAKMKDNRILDTKMRKEEREEVKQAYQEWQEETGEKLETVNSFNILSRSKVDSYTGDVIEDTTPKKKRKLKRKRK